MAKKKSVPVEKFRRPAAQVAGTTEVGFTGLNQMSGMVREEFHKDLQGKAAIAVYREMWMNEPIVNAIMFAVSMLMRQAKWYVRPWIDPALVDATPAAGKPSKTPPPPPSANPLDPKLPAEPVPAAPLVEADPDAKEKARFVESCMTDMAHSWEDMIIEVLTMLPFGWSLLETVYKRRAGPMTSEADSSRFSDGLIGWKKLPIRSQDSLKQWVFDPVSGAATAMVQQTVTGQTATIPLTKALLFRTQSHKNNPEGRSVLRGSYRPWYFKKRIEEVEGIGVERDLAGLPVLTPPEGLDIWNTQDPAMSTLRQAAEKIVRNIRRDEQEGVLKPFGWQLELLSTGGRRAFDTGGIIDRYNNLIAMTVLADFIILGHNNRYGSFALGSAKTHMFGLAIGGWLDAIKAVFNRYAIPRLFAVNGWPPDRLPTLEYEDIETPNLADLGTYITALSGAGMQLFPNPVLEKYLLRVGTMPVDGVTVGREAPQPVKVVGPDGKPLNPFGGTPKPGNTEPTPPAKNKPTVGAAAGGD